MQMSNKSEKNDFSFLSVTFSDRNRKATGSDSKFFTNSKKGENHELREELRSPQRDRKRDAVKKVFKFSLHGFNVYLRLI
jgi:hypothetical protein